MGDERRYLSLQKLKEKNNNIIAIGGYDKNDNNNIVEEYDFMKQKWCKLPNTIDKHRDCGIYILNNIFYVFGDQWNRDGNYGICEMYDTRQEKWSTMHALSKLFDFTNKIFFRVLYVK